MGLFVKGFAAAARVVDFFPGRIPVVLCLGGYVKEALRPEKIAGRRTAEAFGKSKGCAELRHVIVSGKTVVQSAALRVETVADGDGLQKGGFSRAVLKHKKSNVFGE